jgi:hypothetical protein
MRKPLAVDLGARRTRDLARELALQGNDGLSPGPHRDTDAFQRFSLSRTVP